MSSIRYNSGRPYCRCVGNYSNTYSTYLLTLVGARLALAGSRDSHSGLSSGVGLLPHARESCEPV